MNVCARSCWNLGSRANGAPFPDMFSYLYNSQASHHHSEHFLTFSLDVWAMGSQWCDVVQFKHFPRSFHHGFVARRCIGFQLAESASCCGMASKSCCPGAPTSCPSWDIQIDFYLIDMKPIWCCMAFLNALFIVSVLAVCHELQRTELCQAMLLVFRFWQQSS